MSIIIFGIIAITIVITFIIMFWLIQIKSEENLELRQELIKLKQDNNNICKETEIAKAQNIDLEKVELDYEALKEKTSEKASEYEELKEKTSDYDILKKKLSEYEVLRQKTADYDELKKKISYYEEINEKREDALNELFSSNLKAMPYLAGMVADYKTIEYEVLAKKLDWGSNIQREKKVKDIRIIRAEAREQIEKAKESQYQLEYLLQLYPELEDIISTDYRELSLDVLNSVPEHDPLRDYLSKEEYYSLSETARNQLALDRYIASRKKTKWQIGRDYENYVGYIYEKQGAFVEYMGSLKKLEDLGRDLIVRRNGEIRIIQCKYWSKDKVIHEKHIFQLYGTVISYCIENAVSEVNVKGILVTNITLSEKAKEVADRLGIIVQEHYEIGQYPRIKCNIGRDAEFGYETKIYHLPMDLQYDSVKINKSGECYAFTVEEAERKGFRRAYKWHQSMNNL